MFRFQSDRLKIKQKLGSGRSGAVFPYQKDPQDLKWVVKRIRADDIDALLSSLPEIVLGFSCEHPHVVPIKAYFIEQDSNRESFNIYMKLPRMQETLLDEFKNRKKENKPYSEEEIVRHFYSLVSGLEYLHNKRIYHGDIKPNNLLLDQNRTLHIADVGIAKHVEEGDEYQTVTEKIGTYQYSAPEILGAERKDIKKEALAKADIWSLGVVILELCTFDLKLLNSSDREETRKRIQKYLQGLTGKCHHSLIALMKKILNLDSKERPDIVQIKGELETNFSGILVLRFFVLEINLFLESRFVDFEESFSI